MSTHVWHCAWCGKQTSCCNDEHIFGSGQHCCCDFDLSEKDGNDFYYREQAGYDQSPPVEFCSKGCFEALLSSMNKRLAIAQKEYPEWWGGKPRGDNHDSREIPD